MSTVYVHQSTVTNANHPIQATPASQRTAANGLAQPSPVIVKNNPIEGYRVLNQNHNVSTASNAQSFLDHQNSYQKQEQESQIRLQASRVQKLEESLSQLQEESARQDQILITKLSESVQWQENYNALRDEFLGKSQQISAFEDEIDSILKKQAQYLAEIESNEAIIRNFHNDIYARNEDIQYWKVRSVQQQQHNAQLDSLQQQIEIITQENIKLNKLLLQNSDYPK